VSLSRRGIVKFAAWTAALSPFGGAAAALDYPTRPVRIIVGFPTGSQSNIVARWFGQWLSERLGQPFVVETRPGAGTNIATETIVQLSTHAP
jgi:tripartite-type tricarboxylate transporter receptor subunit TctC